MLLEEFNRMNRESQKENWKCMVYMVLMCSFCRGGISKRISKRELKGLEELPKAMDVDLVSPNLKKRIESMLWSWPARMHATGRESQKENWKSGWLTRPRPIAPRPNLKKRIERHLAHHRGRPHRRRESQKENWKWILFAFQPGSGSQANLKKRIERSQPRQPWPWDPRIGISKRELKVG